MGLHEGVTVKHDALMGRTIVATRPFAPGEVIVSDTPVLVWDDPPDRGYPFLLRAFQRCDKAAQKRILGMYHPALDRTSAMLEAGQDKGDSTSLQRECSARARSGKSIHASRPFREMIARPKISQNEWKTAEI